MARKLSKQQRALEVMLIVVAAGLTALLYRMQAYKIVILNLYFLPVALTGLFLGRYRAGVMSVLCVIAASVVTAINLAEVAVAGSPLVVALAVTVWGAVLGLTALLIGTLSDERTSKLQELHDAYVGVVEVLSQYLQSAHPRLKARSIRVAELSQQIAGRMKLSPHDIDDIRVGALLYDVGNIEITTRVIRRAMDTLDADTSKLEPQTIQGADLMLSLGSVLNGAVPLLLSQQEVSVQGEHDSSPNVPVGARIICAARAYNALTEGAAKDHRLAPAAAIRELRTSRSPAHDPNVLAALEWVLGQNERLAISSTAAKRASYSATESVAN